MLLQKSGESKIMDFKFGNLQKHVTQLHKSLERLPKRPPPKDVHQLRRQIRSLEAIMNALTAGRVRHLLKALILVRKAAGKVRDMDVLVELACSLSTARNAECLVQLLEYLGGRRVKASFLEAVLETHRERPHLFKEDHINEPEVTTKYSGARAISFRRAEQLPSNQ